MAGEPRVTFSGNLTGDPELRYVASGKPVTSFTVAVNAFNKNRATGQYEKGESTFFRCAVWGDMAENTAESLTKGTRVNVEGRLTVRQYESQGQTRTSLDVVVDEIGPSLRYAKTTITKTTPGGQGGGYGAPPQGPQQGGMPPQHPAGSYQAAGYDPWQSTGPAPF